MVVVVKAFFCPKVCSRELLLAESRLIAKEIIGAARATIEQLFVLSLTDLAARCMLQVSPELPLLRGARVNGGGGDAAAIQGVTATAGVNGQV